MRRSSPHSGFCGSGLQPCRLPCTRFSRGAFQRLWPAPPRHPWYGVGRVKPVSRRTNHLRQAGPVGPECRLAALGSAGPGQKKAVAPVGPRLGGPSAVRPRNGAAGHHGPACSALSSTAGGRLIGLCRLRSGPPGRRRRAAAACSWAVGRTSFGSSREVGKPHEQ